MYSVTSIRTETFGFKPKKRKPACFRLSTPTNNWTDWGWFWIRDIIFPLNYWMPFKIDRSSHSIKLPCLTLVQRGKLSTQRWPTFNISETNSIPKIDYSRNARNKQSGHSSTTGKGRDRIRMKFDKVSSTSTITSISSLSNSRLGWFILSSRWSSCFSPTTA